MKTNAGPYYIFDPETGDDYGLAAEVSLATAIEIAQDEEAWVARLDNAGDLRIVWPHDPYKDDNT